MNPQKGKTLACIFLVVVGVACLTSIASAQPPPFSAAAGNAFAVDLYGRLAAETGNLFFSPASIQIALCMAYAGARGQTASQMADVLHVDTDLPDRDIHADYAALIEMLNTPRMITRYEQTGDTLQVSERAAYELVIANALWGQKGCPWHREFLDLTAAAYGAGLREVDFSSQPEAARETINAWVARETRDRIRDLIARGHISPLMRLIITNAIYFKAAWAKPFLAHATRPMPFHLSAAEQTDTAMMFQKQHFRYMETETFQALELPYEGDGLSLIVFLPKPMDGLARFEADLTPAALDAWIGQLRFTEVAVYLPTFEFAGSFRLARILQAMGMADAFSDRVADFSGMTDAEKLFIADVIHKAFVAVDEAGTTAAAATAVMMPTAAMPVPEPDPKIVKADHPFWFCIRHNASGKLLFMGRLSKPEGT